VAEFVEWGDTKIAAHGLGAYIAQTTKAGDFPKIILGIAVMSLFVTLFNRLLWRPLVEPTLLLMDEPFSALDVLTAETLRTDLLDLWTEAARAPSVGTRSAGRAHPHRAG
jgi:hypothetical protein